MVKVEGVTKAFGDNRVLDGVDLKVARGDRLAIVGPNGIGKSTLLKVMTGRLEADGGAVEWGYETYPGFFAQDPKDHLGGGGEGAMARQTAAEWIGGYCEGKGMGFARGQLGLVLLGGEDADKRLGALSGGETARLVLCSLMIRMPNVLVLDEPTNHLDLESIEALVKGLKGFGGTLVFVSHDRWFVERLANRIVEITAEGVRDYRGTYEEYVRYCGDDHLDVERVVGKGGVDGGRGDGRGGGGGRDGGVPKWWVGGGRGLAGPRGDRGSAGRWRLAPTRWPRGSRRRRGGWGRSTRSSRGPRFMRRPAATRCRRWRPKGVSWWRRSSVLRGCGRGWWGRWRNASRLCWHSCRSQGARA